MLPLHDEHSAYRLTSSVDLALRCTSDPPPPMVETMPLEAYDPDALDIRESSTKTWLLNSDIPAAASRSGRFRWGRLAVAGAGVVLAGAAALAFLLHSPSTADQRADAGVVEPAAAPVAAEPAEEVATESRATESAALPETIEVELGDLPRGARVWIDGKRAQLPLVLPGSDQPVILKVTAPGYNSYEKALVPDRDYDVHVSMARKTAGGKPGPKARNKASKKKGLGQVWADNPFSE
jgi:hypothetical protein